MSTVHKIVIILLFACLSGAKAFAQADNVEAAVAAQQAGNADLAIQLIDKAIKDPELAKDFSTWYYRGFIYREYAKKQTGDLVLKNYLISLESFKKSIQLDISKENFDQDSINIIQLGQRFKNLSATSMKIESYDKAIELIELYKQCLKIANPKVDLRGVDTEFKLALGSLFTNEFEKSKAEKREEYFRKAIDTFNGVLELDSNNVKANYNIGMNFYNKGAGLWNDASALAELDIIQMDQKTDQARECYRLGLPYLLKSYRLNPKRRETLQGLINIYQLLYEVDKQKQMQTELDALN